MRRFPLLGLVALCLGFCAPGGAQTPMVQPSPATVSIGRAVIALHGPWKFHIGDDPRWADPNFDDSQWETVDLVPKAGSFDPISGVAGYVPGWTARGHTNYWGFAWYRMRVQVDARPGESLSVAYFGDVDDAYQAYANGVLLGSFGEFSNSRTPVIFNSQPRMFQLPEAQSAGQVTEILAFRVWMEPNTLLSSPDAGGMHGPPLLGQTGAVTAGYQLAWLSYVRTYGPSCFDAGLFLLLAILAGTLILFDRLDAVYWWLASVFLLTAIDRTALCIGAWTQLESLVTLTVLQDVFVRPLILGGWVMVWWAWFRLRRPVWLPKFVAAMTALYMLSDALGEDLFFNLIPHPVSAVFHLVSLSVRILFLFPLFYIVFEGVGEQGREGWLALPAVILVGIAQFQTELSVLHVRTTWFPFGLQITIGQIAELTLAAVLMVLLLRRLLLSLRQQRELAMDVKQAQEVQQVILPGAITWLPGFAIESEYRPAREVGGDFFQIIPQSKGGVMIVAGDVAGKGLQAGMLVALLAGAIRSTAELNADPEYMLQSLNRRLLLRGHACATCLAMHIAEDGSVTLANAGHLPPYINGRSVAMEGALPLGMLAETEFPVMNFRLNDGDRMVLVSDGIAEAMNAEKKLFGFERVQEMLAQRSMSASVLADAAQNFGQEDDISVIAITRAEVLKPVLV